MKCIGKGIDVIQDKMAEKISIVMSVYNEPLDYIETTMNSLVNQTYTNIEIIVVIDNPEYQDAIMLLRKYKDIILLINEKNKGLATSLNIGIGVSTGKIIARMDSDDIAHQDRIEHEYNFMKKNEYDIVTTNVNMIDEDGRQIENRYILPKSENEFKKRLRFGNCLIHPTFMFKRDLYDKIGGYKDELVAAQDYEFIINAYTNGFKFGFLDEKLLDYRVRMNSISKSKGAKQIFIADYINKTYVNKQIYVSDYIKKCFNGEKKDFKMFEREYELYQKNINKHKWYILIALFKFKYIRRSLLNTIKLKLYNTFCKMKG